MVQEFEDAFVREFQFDERNTRHLQRHGGSPDLVWLIWLDQPVFIWNRQPHPVTHLMIGVDPLAVLDGCSCVDRVRNGNVATNHLLSDRA
jgi:hypothetical protein